MLYCSLYLSFLSVSLAVRLFVLLCISLNFCLFSFFSYTSFFWMSEALSGFKGFNEPKDFFAGRTAMNQLIPWSINTLGKKQLCKSIMNKTVLFHLKIGTVWHGSRCATQQMVLNGTIKMTKYALLDWGTNVCFMMPTMIFSWYWMPRINAKTVILTWV